MATNAPKRNRVMSSGLAKAVGERPSTQARSISRATVTRSRGIAALSNPRSYRTLGPSTKRNADPRKRIATRVPVGKPLSANAKARTKGAARLGAGSG